MSTEPPALEDQEEQQAAVGATPPTKENASPLQSSPCREPPLAQFKGVQSGPALRRGFFDGAARKVKPAATQGRSQRKSCPDLRIVKPRQEAGITVPDIMKIPLSKEEQQMKALQGAMQPTPESMFAVMGDPELLAGFDDPDVMKAVAEIASSPAAFRKHAHNAKVMSFYRKMGHFLEGRMEQQSGMRLP